MKCYYIFPKFPVHDEINQFWKRARQKRKRCFHMTWENSNWCHFSAIRAGEMALGLTFRAGNGLHLRPTISKWSIQVTVNNKTKRSTIDSSNSFTFCARYHPQIAASLAHTQRTEHFKVEGTACTCQNVSTTLITWKRVYSDNVVKTCEETCTCEMPLASKVKPIMQLMGLPDKVWII